MRNLEAVYLCNMEKPCRKDGGCGGDMCCHTSDTLFAKNQDSIRIFNEFDKTFALHEDEDGRIYAVEKERKDG